MMMSPTMLRGVARSVALATVALVGITLFHPAACMANTVPPGQTPSPFPLSFDSELIQLFIEADSVRVVGTYYLTCRHGGGRPIRLHYPYPRDHRLGGARTLYLETQIPGESWQPARYLELADHSGASWWLPPLDPGAEITVRTAYRQARYENYAQYIVTTTSAWGRPLQRARFEIHLTPGAEPSHFSFPFELCEDGDQLYYVFEADSFQPNRDIVVEWE